MHASQEPSFDHLTIYVSKFSIKSGPPPTSNQFESLLAKRKPNNVEYLFLLKKL